MSDQNKYPIHETDMITPFMTDEQFVEATGGLDKGDMHSLMVDMRQVGIKSFNVTGDDGQDVPVIISPENLENGSLFPELAVHAEGVTTIMKSYPGENCSFMVIDSNTSSRQRGNLAVKGGIEIQDVTDFGLIPSTHWRALRYAKSAIERDNPSKDPEFSMKRRGGIVGHILLGKHYLKLPK